MSIRLTIPDVVREAVQHAAGAPVALLHEPTGEEYIVLPKAVFDAIHAAQEIEGLTDAEQDYLLREAGLRAGWDDSAMDIYNDLDPRRQP